MLSKLLSASIALSAATFPAFAAESLSTRYDVSLIGLPVGRASFDTTISGRTFTVDGTIASAGLADIFSTVKGTSTVSGRIEGDRLSPGRYGLAYTSDKKAYKSDVAFRSGRVASATVKPKPKPNKDYVPVSKQQLQAVVDPLSGLMVKAGKADDVCKRTLPFFDGWSRLDLALSPAGRKRFETDGFAGEAVVCDVRVLPVGGFRATSSGVKFIARQTLQIWFAPIKDTGIYAPVYARVPTEIGPLTFRASRFAKG